MEQMKVYKWTQNNQAWHIFFKKAITDLYHFKKQKEKEKKKGCQNLKIRERSLLKTGPGK